MIKYPNRSKMMASIVNGKRGAEVGVQHGHFAHELLNLDAERLWLIDPWVHWPVNPSYSMDPANVNQQEQDGIYQYVMDRFSSYIWSGRVAVIRSPSLHAVNMFDEESLDFVYIDAMHDHKSVLDDLHAWAPRVKKGGYLCGHDYTESEKAKGMGFGVVSAVNEFCETTGRGVTYTTEEEWPSYAIRM